MKQKYVFVPNFLLSVKDWLTECPQMAFCNLFIHSTSRYLLIAFLTQTDARP